jgi:dipeptidyl aminopeptidase/acylaminoacyl peptidase
MTIRILFGLLVLAFVTSAAAAADDNWEPFPDGSAGRATEFHGAGGIAISAYVRKPNGPGPFPVVILAHGGRYGSGPTDAMGRSPNSPTEDFIKAGWAVYSIDYRPAVRISIEPIEVDDTVEAVKAVRALPFIDSRRVGYLGGSHGAQVGSRLVSHADLSGAVLCAPAAMDLIEDKKAIVDRGEKLAPILMRLVKDMEAHYGATAEEIEKDPGKFGYASAFTEVSEVRCPILIINGRNDNNSPVSIIDRYVKKLRAAGKRVETYLPENGPHGFYFGHPAIPEYQEATRRAVAFFQQCFNGSK